jgi:hypothetical protein
VDYDPKYLDEFGGVLEGAYIPGALPKQLQPDYVKAYTARFGQAPELYGALGHDMLGLVLDVLAKQSWSPAGLAERILERRWEGAAIPGFHYRRDRTVSFPLELDVVKGRDFVPVPAEK